MPLARMMARSETFQERANSSPGLQAFLEKKGDEHAFSCLYLIAGIVCLYAAFSHGNEFCTVMPASEMAKAAPVLASAKAVPHRTLLSQQLVATSKARLAAMKGSMLDEEGGDEAAADTAAEAPAAEDPAAEAPAAEETGSGDNATDTSANGSPSDSSDSEGSLEMAKATFLGAHGWVVTWLTVEGFTALGLPLVSIAMLLMRMHENACVSCILYLVAVFQALWLIVGCSWAFGGFVPEACRHGEMGDNFAYNTMWWVCAIWLGSMLTISMVICCILICLMGFAGSSRAESNKYEQVNGGQNV